MPAFDLPRITPRGAIACVVLSGVCAMTSQAQTPPPPPSSLGTGQSDALDFRRQAYQRQTTEVLGKTIVYRAYEGIAYVRRPIEPRYQTLNIYIPEAYFENRSIDGWTAQTAPIFLPNQVGGYMPSEAGKPGVSHMGPPPAPGSKPQADAMQVALAKGFIVASPGARGRTSITGKAPAAIVDLKAAVRYLHANDSVMPGDANKIIANGTSAGGALSVLLGATGNYAAYEAYLTALGAAKAPDTIHAVSAYCPITLLDQADAAYEWQFNGVNDYQRFDFKMLDYKVQRTLVSGQLTNEQIALSNALKPLFPPYVNSLRLKDGNGQPLTLDAKGNGSFKRYVEAYLQQSAQQQIDAGEDLSRHPWLSVKNRKVVRVDFDAYAREAGRQKTPPAFDAVDLSSGENQLFGSASADMRHFTEFAQAHSTVANATRADAATVALMNPMHRLGQSPTRYWRIRVGTADRDTSLAIAALLAAKLQNTGHTVDFALDWNVPHRGDYDLDALFDWIKQVTRSKP